MRMDPGLLAGLAMSRIPSLVVALFVLSSVAGRGSALVGDPVASTPRLPDNIHVSSDLEPLVLELLRRSETFRRQCAIIAAANVRVTVMVTVKLRLSVARARATIGPLGQGLWALIELPPVANYAELLPHEMEHVIEQVEGIDLEAGARAGDAGVSINDDGYETSRARAAGLSAAAEFYTQADPALTAAGRAASRVWRALGSRTPDASGWATRLRAGSHKDF
jgi:hypothetical protein